MHLYLEFSEILEPFTQNWTVTWAVFMMFDFRQNYLGIINLPVLCFSVPDFVSMFTYFYFEA